jgi:hypothetical protein
MQLTLVVFLSPTLALAGPFSGPQQTSHEIDPAIPASSNAFVEWADAIQPVGQGSHLAPRGSSSITDSGVISLGDLSQSEIDNNVQPGYLTVTFPTGISDGPGADFAAFENGFTFLENDNGTPGLFAEYAYVEVSSDGEHFARFPSIDRNTGPLGDGWGRAFTGFDVTNVKNLAGKHAAGFGTPFDLAELSSQPLVANNTVNLDNIQFVRLVDIPGNGDFLDSEGNPIVDNWMTSGTGGYDFNLSEGIGVINTVPEPTSAAIALIGAGLLLTPPRRRT